MFKLNNFNRYLYLAESAKTPIFLIYQYIIGKMPLQREFDL